jgi:hypothetical protein
MSTNPRPHRTSTPRADPDTGDPASAGSRPANEPLIPGIYQTCDQWCSYCPATHRCLAFRSTNANDVDGIWDPTDDPDAERVGDGMLFMQALADAEGVASPPEVEAMLSGDPVRQRATFGLNHPLERLGRSYMMLAEAYLKSRADFPPGMTWRPDGPTPLEVLTWYHVLAPSRVFRAILCANDAAGGMAGRHDEALCAAKGALVGIDRSLAALTTIATEDADPRVELLHAQLLRLRDAIEVTFPDARPFIRPGLDGDPATDAPRLVRRVLRRIGELLPWRHPQQVPRT